MESIFETLRTNLQPCANLEFHGHAHLWPRPFCFVSRSPVHHGKIKSMVKIAIFLCCGNFMDRIHKINPAGTGSEPIDSGRNRIRSSKAKSGRNSGLAEIPVDPCAECHFSCFWTQEIDRSPLFWARTMPNMIFWIFAIFIYIFGPVAHVPR